MKSSVTGWMGFGLLCLVLSTGTALGQDGDEVLTVVLEGGNVYDGLGADPVVADVGIHDGRIVAVGDLKARRAGERLDVRGLAVVPGFIDIHSHGTRGVFRHPLAENYIRQGVTMIVGGPDGGSPLPVAEYLARLELHPPAVNFALMVGHGTIRRKVMGNEDRAPEPEELERMRGMVEAAMREGAFGLSSGLKYVPGAYAKTEELIELARVAGRHGGIYISHMREEGLELLESVSETIRIGEEGGLPTQITHHKVVGAPMWGSSVKSLALVDEARARGVDVTLDQYPYTASSTSLSILFPAWSLEGEEEDRLSRLRDPAQRSRIKAAVLVNLEKDRGGGHPKNVVVSRCEWDPTLNGKSLADILRDRNREVTLDEAAELALELQERGGFGGIFHAMVEEDVQRIMRHPQTMIASDGGIVAPGEGVPHPRNYGTFSRVLGHYSRDLGTLTFQEAVRKMSSSPARRLGLEDRGVIREGAMADVAVLSPPDIEDMAVFGKPHQYATGARHVFVGGVAVLLNEKMTGARPGKALRHRSR
jgi:N-acyl-D-amino-acid deacylase